MSVQPAAPEHGRFATLDTTASRRWTIVGLLFTASLINYFDRATISLPGGSTIVSLLFPPARRALPNGLFDAGTRTGLVMEGVLVPWMLTTYGWRTSFLLVGFAALVWLLPWFIVTPAQLRAPRS